jgi:hypothetical protein
VTAPSLVNDPKRASREPRPVPTVFPSEEPRMSQYYEELPTSKEPRQRGCFFYGCLTASILGLVFVVGMGILVYKIYRYGIDTAKQYTDTRPTPLPTVEMPAEQVKDLHARVDAFRAALDEGKPTEPLALTADELNALIADNPDFKGKVHADIKGDEVSGQVSIPLQGFPRPFRELNGRYINGKADLKVSLESGVLVVMLDKLEVKGQPVPESVMTQLRQQNLAQDAYKNPKNAEAIRKFESIQVKDGKIIIKARSKGAAAAEDGAKDAEMKGPEEAAKPSEGKVEEKADSGDRAEPKPAERPPGVKL